MPLTTNDGLNKDIAPQENWRFASVFSIAVGLIAFLAVVGPRALQPRNIAWLGQGDPATHYLGWLFFRNSEWSFPIGLNPKYGLEISNAILFSDSNPLLAIIFKPFSHFLPETFQYFGIWLLACFILQAWFAFKLVGLITKSLSVRTLAASFFIFAPPMIWRLHGHLSLVGHFLVLASIYLALTPSPKRRIISWAALLVVSALTHAYFLVMIGLIWAADMLGRLIKRSLPISRATLEFSIVFGATLLACWQAGYFSVGEGVSSGGFGYFRMNLLSVLDPSGWSYVLRDIPEAGGDYEGFNYLGLGMIFLGICSLPSLLNAQTGLANSVMKRPALLVAILCLTTFALSNKLGIGSVDFEFKLSDFLMVQANTFRASGRMFWPVYYLIFFTFIFLIVRGYSKRVVIILLGLGLVIQIADTSKVWLDIRAKLMTTPTSTWQTKMTDPFWNEAAAKYSKVRLPLPEDHASWQAVASYAGSHTLATDAVYLARVGKSVQEAAQKKAMATLQSGEFESDSLYILEESRLRQVALTLDAQSDLLAQIDGFTVVAPGWKKCATCPKVLGEVKVSDYLPSPLRAGEHLLFSQYQSGLRYTTSGWSHPEDWGTWSDGADAIILLPLETERASTILVEANPLLSHSHPKQTVEVKINGIPTNSVTLTANSGGKFEIEIPEKIRQQLRHNKVLKLQLHFPDAARPVDIGINSDGRMLAIGLIALTVQ